jgi:aminoglycoside/choline kinase family phosphotransferase
MNAAIQQQLTQLFEKTFNEKVTTIEILPAASASDRRYARLSNTNRSVIGAHNTKKKENISFLAFAKHLHNKGVAIPEIYAEDLKSDIYLQEDLGEHTLLQTLQKEKTTDEFPESVLKLYQKVVQDLAFLQIKGDEGLDYQLCSESQKFDKRAMMFDLNAFQFHFLKMVGLPYDAEKLERDFKRLVNYLTKEEGYNYFMFRDFQSRNIMIKEGKPYYIDFQSGRKGPLQYDLASLIYQAKADLPQEVREELTDTYIEAVSELIDIDIKQFRQQFYGYVILRTMQVLSTYGYRGFYQRKSHFLTSIPFALKNLEWLLDNGHFPKRMPTLKKVLKQLTKMEELKTINDKYSNPNSASKLLVTISSFSYKRGIPADESGHGGGFVFDCRNLNNPGRYAPYRKLTGRDEPVKQFLETQSAMPDFLQNVYALVDRAVKNYIDREFSHLMVSFGCTGGQHRSVYSADHLAKHLTDKFDIEVKINHVEQELKNWEN